MTRLTEDSHQSIALLEKNTPTEPANGQRKNNEASHHTPPLGDVKKKEKKKEKQKERQDKEEKDSRREEKQGEGETDRREEEESRRRKEEEEEEKKKKKKKSNDVDIPDDGVPYDRGWAWMIVLAGFVNFVVAAGYNRGTFIFFVNFLEEFQAPVTETALLFGVKSGVNSIVGLFIMNAVVGRFGVRKTVLVGSICISLSAILGSFAYDVTSLILSQAVLHGLGMSMLNQPCTVLLGFYFKRRRSLANSVAKCGVGIGAVAFPPVVTYLLKHYGLRGALLLMGAICLHSVMAAMLLRPVSFYKKRKRLSDEEESCAGVLVVGDGKAASATKADRKYGDDCDESRLEGTRCRRTKANTDVTADENGNPQATRAVYRLGKGESDGVGDHCDVVIEQEVRSISCLSGQTKELTELHTLSWHLDTVDLSKSAPNLNLLDTNTFRPRARSFSDHKAVCSSSSADRTGHVLDVLSQSHVVHYMSSPNLELDGTPCVVTAAPGPTDRRHSLTSRTCWGRARAVGSKVVGVLDFGLFHSPMFRLLAVFFFTCPMAQAVTTYLPAMATERGLDQDQIAVLLSIIGGLDFCCRLACGFIADLKILKVSTMIGFGFTILGVVCQLTPFMTSFSLLIGLAVVQGLLGGVAACLVPILIMEDIGLENTAKALGFNKLFSGAAMAAFHPFLGYIRDSTGSYDVAYHVIGGVILLSAAVIVCVRFMPHTLPSSRDITGPHTEQLSPLNQHSADDNVQQTKSS
ncbi:monocarboxylate transporter 5-like isoform X2 [Babylonia areolata]|uniref:monocarboxylate transporter 5-like isoform X2 n=1 Tax=Babylonia areolata TaxID=304850 RepID=UPI003FD12563